LFFGNLTFWRDPWNGNHSPVANAGPDQTVEVEASGVTAVALDGSATTDPDNDELSYQWMFAGGLIAIGVNPTVEFAIGTHRITLVVRDQADAVGIDEVDVDVLAPPTSFIRGDSNGDSTVDISDAINTLGFLFTGGGEVICKDAADSNDDGSVDISDAIATLSFLFLGTPPTLPVPYPTRGSDPTPDVLGCGR